MKKGNIKKMIDIYIYVFVYVCIRILLALWGSPNFLGGLSSEKATNVACVIIPRIHLSPHLRKKGKNPWLKVMNADFASID